MTEKPKPPVAGDSVDFKELSPITREQLRTYAEASGDHNPIHLDEGIAKSSGLPGIIAHGMLSAALIAERALDFEEQASASQRLCVRRFQTRFKAMVFPGDRISIGGTVREASADRLVLDLQAKNQRGEAVTQATVEFGR